LHTNTIAYQHFRAVNPNSQTSFKPKIIMQTVQNSLEYLDFSGKPLIKWLEENNPKLLQDTCKEPSLKIAIDVIENEVHNLSQTSALALHTLWKKDLSQTQGKDAMTLLLGLCQCVINQFDIIQMSGFYQDIFRHKIKANAKQLKEDMIASLDVYYNAVKRHSVTGEEVDMVQTIVETVDWFVKVAFRVAECDKETMRLFYSQFDALLRFYHLPHNEKDVIDLSPVTESDLAECLSLIQLRKDQDEEIIKRRYAQATAKYKIGDVVGGNSGHIYRILDLTFEGQVTYKGEYLRKDFRRKKVNGVSVGTFFESEIITQY
jgi:hypothetical protein